MKEHGNTKTAALIEATIARATSKLMHIGNSREDAEDAAFHGAMCALQTRLHSPSATFAFVMTCATRYIARQAGRRRLETTVGEDDAVIEFVAPPELHRKPLYECFRGLTDLQQAAIRQGYSEGGGLSIQRFGPDNHIPAGSAVSIRSARCYALKLLRSCLRDKGLAPEDLL